MPSWNTPRIHSGQTLLLHGRNRIRARRDISYGVLYISIERGVRELSL
jgi:hypothetical protein